jgi:hypothetical protein
MPPARTMYAPRPQQLLRPANVHLSPQQMQQLHAQAAQRVASYPIRSVQQGYLSEDGQVLDANLEVQPDSQPAFGLPPQDLINSLYDIFGKYPRKNVLPYFFSFSLTVAQGNALTALGTQRPSIKITADAAMISTLITGASTGEYTCFMRTDSSDRQLMQFPIHSAAMVGTAERPFPLPKPLLLAPNTTISFDITDLSNAVNEVYFTFCGFKVYRRQYAAAG